MYLVNGIASTTIDVADRGFQYGDGLFETIEIFNRQAVFLEQHLQRLQTGCARLYLPTPDTKLLVSEINKVCTFAPVMGQAVVKLILTRGAGGRGYRQPDIIEPTRVISLHPFPDYPDSYPQQGVIARFCHTRLGLNPALAGIKHLNRLEQVLARAEWSDPGIQEGIMLDMNDHVIEGTMSNIFYVKNNVLYTAQLTQSGVAGVMRQIIIGLCTQNKLAVIEHHYTKADILSADEIFFSNSIMGIWPVRQIEGSPFSVGPISRQIQQWLARSKFAGVGVAA
ncbi:MAG: aminodeoxychorismate lyase [Methylovulum sp.]|uniref:aminodeoxychorismate lyase n=1 Tax=Methylovulum sp. TaxID=1916980 RepID=UPI00262FFC51|nr:aminodeoxychorismate lyase [Methylovulum sp.]MDD2723906.1 aminodeoxychorismate lyase [Methylovulum sp.]MDD5125235.1 aminodeoxychorismate lyase [Methylovulum sp.]